MTTKKQQDTYEKAEQYIDGISPEGYHLYVRKDCIHSVSDYHTLMDETEPFGNLYLDNAESDIDVEDYMMELIAHEATCKSTRLLETVKVCIPEDFSEQHYTRLASAIASSCFTGSDGVIPYFLRVGAVKETRYLYICFSERYYYPEGKTVKILYKSDFYRNPVNGQRCKKDDPNGVLVLKKGDVRKEEVIHFSLKERMFRINDGMFYALMKQIRTVLIDLFRSIIPLMRTALVGRLNYDDLSFADKHKCIEINKMFIRVEKEITDVLNAYSYADFTDCLKKLKTSIKQWRLWLLRTDGKVQINEHHYTFNISFGSNKKRFKENISLLEDGFNQIFNRFLTKMADSEEIRSITAVEY